MELFAATRRFQDRELSWRRKRNFGVRERNNEIVRHPNKTVKRAILVVATSCFLLGSALRLPAPIMEESTPTPAAKEVVKTKPKRTESNTNRREAAATTRTPAPTKKFAGKWSGIMPEIPWGNVETELTVDENESTMQWRDKIGSNSKSLTAKTTLSGNTLSARFPVGFTTAVWYITPRPDGLSADIRMTAFMNEDHGVFQRVSR